MWMVNGELASEITVSDRGFMYGDGYFTTLQWRDGQPQFWDWHVERLQSTAQRLRMPSPDTDRLLARLRGLMVGQGDGGAKIMISRGQGVRGYSPQGCMAPTEIIQTLPCRPTIHSGGKMASSWVFASSDWRWAACSPGLKA